MIPLESRADPDALLDKIRQSGRGKLTVFLGSSAGVGKTYAMLAAAKECLLEGKQLLIGWVETHGRVDTEALVHGIPTIPPCSLVYQGRTFQEMNLSEILRLHPQIVLVDELAHTNIPGSLHIRRYQDVEELLTAGIDVYTTVNIQHIESLNDVVARITGVVMHETVPDRVLQGSEIKLIDIPPEALLQRLAEGKVYMPTQAKEAAKNFFRVGNLTALRELALRYTTQHIDTDLETYMRAHAISGPWPAAERIMVCVSESPFSAQLIRTAYRLAASLKSPWIAAYIEIPRLEVASDREKQALAENLRLAEELGAELVTIVGDEVASEIIRLARRRNVTHLLIGKPALSNIHQFFRGSIFSKILKQSEGLSVHIISEAAKNATQRLTPRRAPSKIRLMPAFLTITMVALITVLGKFIESTFGLVNIALGFLLPVMVSAILWGRYTALLGAFIAAICFDFLFIPPVLHFTVSDVRYLFSFVMFHVVAFVTGTLAGRLRHHAHEARKREVRISALYSLSKNIAGTEGLDTVLEMAAERIAESVNATVVILLADESGELQVKSCANPKGKISAHFVNDNEGAVAAWAYHHGQIAGHGTDTLNGAKGLYMPLVSDEQSIGVIATQFYSSDKVLDPDKHHLIEAFANLIVLAVKRITLAEASKQTYLLRESERLWMTMFNSLSHDLRTPLSSIIGAVTGLLEEGELFDRSARNELLGTIEQEALRMNRLVGNLFDMARLQSGMLQLKKEWCDIEEIVGIALKDLRRSLGARLVKVDLEPELPLIRADMGLIEQVFVNLLDNAIKYSPRETELSVKARCQQEELQVSVSDQGEEIPQGEIGAIFDQFYRGKTSQAVKGTGLGLTICKEIVNAHGGRIWAENPEGQGTTITFTLPLSANSPKGIPEGNELMNHER
jgi:two-component system, OmpR family, sensor histidine kinase KdpD